MEQQKRIDEVTQRGYHLDFGKIIEDSFENYKKIAVTAGLAFLLIMVFVIAIAIGVAALFMGAVSFTEDMADFNITQFSTVGILIYIVGVAFVSGLFSPIGAGLLKMAHSAYVNEEFSVSTIFDYYKSSKFKDLFIATSLISLVSIGISTGIELSGILIVGNLITYVISFFTFFTIPLIMFTHLNAFEAIGVSSQLVLKQAFPIIGLAIVAGFGSMVGLIALCIGVLFTMPFWYSVLFTTYNSILPTVVKSEIDDIGSSETE